MQQTLHCHSPPDDLLQKLENHQRWLQTNGHEGERLGSDEEDDPLNFTGVNLSGYDLSLAQLSSAVFRGCELSGTWFLGAELSGAYFENCALTGSRFNRADLFTVRFVQSNYAD